MYINQAIKEAMKFGKGITRLEYFDAGRGVYFYPTKDSSLNIMVVTVSGNVTPRWQPHVEDLLANDWFVMGFKQKV